MSARHRPVGAIDVTASALARLAPRRLHAHIDQARFDVTALIDGFVGAPRAVIERGGPRPRALSTIDPLEHAIPFRRLRTRYVSLRTDLGWVARDLRGARRPFLVERGPSRYRERPRGQLAPRPFRILAVDRETDDAVSLRLAPLDGRPLVWEAGQFLTFHLPVDGVVLRRAYSFSTAPGEAARVTVKRVDGGRASRWMCERVKAGDVLHALGPSGAFVLSPDDRPLFLLAGGSGVTPIRALARAAADAGRSVHVLLGNRAAKDVILGAELDALAAAHPGRVSVTHALEEPSEGALPGRLDRALGPWLDGLPHADGLFYVCGPTQMMDAVRDALLARAIPPAAIREERFQSPGVATAAPPLARAVTVQLRVRGREHLAPVQPGQTVLEAGLAAGAAMPFSCAMGGCAACKGRVLAGRVVMDEPTCLTPEERQQGAVLTCCARPASDDVRIEIGGEA